MEISNDIQKYKEDIIRIAYEGYQKEIAFHKNIPMQSITVVEEFISGNLNNKRGLVYLEEGKCRGYILYNAWEEDEAYCSIPEWGYGADGTKREKTICHLFQKLAEEAVKDKAVIFSVKLYAHDIEIQRLFSFMEFGFQAETGICIMEKTEKPSGIKIHKLSKAEMVNRWNEVWNLLAQLINHLKKSPVFYPGNEFTEEVYREFFEDAGTKVYIAEADGEMIGLIESNEDSLPLVFSSNEAANVGEAFVLPEYRGQNIARALLNYACNDLLLHNYSFAWVEHGTANPNARYFWNKYFTTYKYEMIRKISGQNEF